MEERLTLALMLFLAVAAGSVTTVIMRKQNKHENKVNNIFSVILYCYFEYWLMNICRTLLLKGDEIYSYAQDYGFLAIDIVIVIAGIIFIYSWHEREEQKYVWIRVIVCVAIAIGYIDSIAINYFKYQNLNAAIYYGLQHDFTTFFGVIIFLAYAFFKQGFEVKKREKIGKIEASVIALFIMTVFIYPVMEIFLTNANEFSFSTEQVIGWFVLFIFGVSIGSFLICGLTKGKIRTGYLLVLWGFSICAYVQEMFLNGKLFLMDGKAAEWNLGLKVSNLIIWCVVLGTVYIGHRLWKNKWKEIMMFSSVVLCLMQLVGVVSLVPSYVGSESSFVRGQKYLSTQGLYEVAKDENIVVFVLDTYDVDHIEEVLEKQPDFLEPLKGFTYFPDTVAQFSRTFPAIPYMLTGRTYFYEIPLNEYVDQAFQSCSIWDGLKKKGYHLYFYEEDEAYIGASIREEAENYVEEGHTIEEKTSFIGCIESIVRINGYRLLPYALKENYFYTAGTINGLVIEEFTLEKPEFVADDVSVYQGLKEQRLQITEEEKAMRFIHLYGAHEPYIMDEVGNRVEAGEGSSIAQYIGCMNMVYEYISMLQELGVYEKTTIIITADHGENFLDEQLKEATNPILFIKPYGVGEDAEIIISDVYASQNDILPTIAAIHEVNYTGNEGMDLFSVNGNDKERIRYHYYTVVEDTTQTKIRDYEIKGCSLDFDSWDATEKYHEFGEYR